MIAKHAYEAALTDLSGSATNRRFTKQASSRARAFPQVSLNKTWKSASFAVSRGGRSIGQNGRFAPDCGRRAWLCLGLLAEPFLV